MDRGPAKYIFGDWKNAFGFAGLQSAFVGGGG